MTIQYEFEKYLTDNENIKNTIEKYGVAICPILNDYECDEMINNKWNLLEYLTSNFEIPIDRNDKSTYKQILELFPNHKMLLQHWKVGHSELVWKVRQNSKVKEVFSKIWNTDDLIVSFDGVSIYILDKPTRIQNSWFHVDQSYTRNNFECIQSWINAYDTNEGDATLVILENSHNYHSEFQKRFEITDKKDWFKLQNKDQYEFYINNNCLENRIKNAFHRASHSYIYTSVRRWGRRWGWRWGRTGTKSNCLNIIIKSWRQIKYKRNVIPTII